ncbi:hypothetical protein GFO_3061 [Christiangramia forsetii KT0803]|uniref:Uncharacterized protein n=1 Tax=Christiangramia forsetii (strain DSM 17595 / CGMCC 1.15422 / KT0803) TaxID=411154 RepID=A0M5W0_CHRFK|nr:hypothetical protein GFO_3061 [Christiangramia forsetii KT0803]
MFYRRPVPIAIGIVSGSQQMLNQVQHDGLTVCHPERSRRMSLRLEIFVISTKGRNL